MIEPLQHSRFSKLSHFSNIWCFFEWFFAQNNSYDLVEWFFACFLNFWFLTQTDHFARAIYSLCMGYSLCKMADFQKLSHFLNILCFCQQFFFTEQLLYSCKMVFCMFLAFLIFDPNWPFCMGYIAFARWAIFKIVSFLEYLVFFRAVFLHRTTLIIL